MMLFFVHDKKLLKHFSLQRHTFPAKNKCHTY
jgi:hypothetical protein